MLADYIDIIKIVMIGIDILIALILLRFVLTGIRRGFARNCYRLVLLLVLVLFFSIGCKGIIRNVIEIELPINYDVYAEEVTIKNIVQTVVADNMFEGDIVALQKSGLTGVIDDVTVSAISIVLFTVMSILIYLLIAPIIMLFSKIIFPFLRKKKNGLKIRYTRLSKLLGLACSLARFAIFMMIFIVPIYGALEIGKVVVDDAGLVDEDMKELSVEVDEALGSSVMLKITSNIGKKEDGAFGFGAKTLGSRFLISTEYGNINFIKEIDGIGGYLPRIIELGYEIMETEDVNQIVDSIEDQDIITITDYFANSNIVKVVYPVAMNFLNGSEETLELDVDIDFEELAKIDISSDLKKLQPFFISVLHCVQQIDLENFDAMDVLNNKAVIEEALDAINIILNLEITDKLVLKLATEYLNEMLMENDLEHLVDLINNDYLKNKLVLDVKSIYNAYLLLDDSGIIDYFLGDVEEFVITEQVKEDLKEFVEIIFNLELIKNQEKKIVQTIFVFTDLDPEFYENMLNENIDWNKEADSVSEILTIVVETALSIDFEIFESDDPLEMFKLLESNNLIDGISEILNIALTMQLSEKYVLPLVIEYVEEFLDSCDLEEFKGIIDVEYIEYDFVNDLNQIIDAYKIFEQTNLLEYFTNKESELVFDENVKSKLEEALNKIIELELIEENEKVLVGYIVALFGESGDFDFEGMLEEDIDWSLELHNLIDVVVDVIEFAIVCDYNQEELGLLIESEQFATLFPNLVEKIFSLQVSEKYIAPIIIDLFNDLLVELGFENFGDYITVDYLKNGLSVDIVTILEIFDLFTELGLGDVLSGDSNITIEDSNQDRFISVMSKLLNLELIDNHEGDLIIMLCDACGLNEFIEYDEESFNNINWDEEVDNIIDVFVAVLDLADIGNLDENYLESDNFEETSEQLANLFDALVKCSITKPFAFDLIDNLLSSIGYEIELAENDKNLIEQNTGKVEFESLTSVAKDVMELISSEDDYTLLNGDDITKLMLDASNGIIASKVMGTVLNEILGENGLDIMPVDPNTGVQLYDFTNPNTLKEQANNIGNCINLVNNLQSFDPENVDSITDIAASLEALGSIEGESNIVEDLLTELLPTDNIEITDDINWSEEAGIVEEVLNLYKDTDEKDDFEITDQELLDKVEESEFAEIILDFLGIFGNN